MLIKRTNSTNTFLTHRSPVLLKHTSSGSILKLKTHIKRSNNKKGCNEHKIIEANRQMKKDIAKLTSSLQLDKQRICSLIKKATILKTTNTNQQLQQTNKTSVLTGQQNKTNFGSHECCKRLHSEIHKTKMQRLRLESEKQQWTQWKQIKRKQYRNMLSLVLDMKQNL